MRRIFIPLVILSLLLSITGQLDSQTMAKAASSSLPRAGIVQASMDKSVKPGDDFYSYANGTWMRNTSIPDDQEEIAAITIANKMRKWQTRQLLDDILESTPPAGSNNDKIATYYRTYLDTDSIDRAGISRVKLDLDAITAIADRRQLSAAIGATLRADTDPLNYINFQTEHLFGVFVTQALKHPGIVVPYLMQGGIGLPEREYYLSSDPRMHHLRGQYRAYVKKLLTLAGYPNAQDASLRIIALETKIARAHATREESEEITDGTQLWTRLQLESKAPGIDWSEFLGAAQLGNAPMFEAYHPTAIPKLAALVGSESLATWKDWLTFHLLNEQANVLPKAFRDAYFAFNWKTLSGIQKERPRDQRALNAVSNALQDAVGKAYVDKYFLASDREKVKSIVDGVKASFSQRVQAIDWLAPTTKQEALKKIDTLVVGIGFPNTWRDYSSLDIGSDAYANQKKAALYEYRHQIAKIGKPMVRDEWWISPQLVNALSLPVQNALNFPAAILQRPFYDPKADPSFNYGAIGVVIGHEVSHSFDSTGSVFDSEGRLRNWWIPADFEKFNQARRQLVAQFNSYEALPGLHVNGQLTLNENTADLAGLAAAYDAYHQSLGGKPAPVIEGFTGDQRFFIAYAQCFASKRREESMREIVATDSHAPEAARAITVRNLDAWYQSFGVSPGDKLFLRPEKRIRLW